MTTLIFGVGFGIFIILALWLAAGLICVISLRTQKQLGLTALGIVGVITIALVSIPRASENFDTDAKNVLKVIATNHWYTWPKPYDQLFIWRMLLTVLLGVSSLVVLLAYVKYELMTPVKAVRLRSWTL